MRVWDFENPKKEVGLRGGGQHLNAGLSRAEEIRCSLMGQCKTFVAKGSHHFAGEHETMTEGGKQKKQRGVSLGRVRRDN